MGEWELAGSSLHSIWLRIHSEPNVETDIAHIRIFKNYPSKIGLLSADISSFVSKVHQFVPILVLVKAFGTLLVLVKDVRASTPGEVAI